jgi:hypothetical protein
VAVAVFDLFQPVGDEMVFDISRAIEIIEAYGDRRVARIMAATAKRKGCAVRGVQRA